MGSRLPTTDPARMPLPDYGHHNAEKKTHQDMVFEMAPEIVSDDDSMEVVNGKKVKRKRGKITTGKLGIDLERTMVIHDEKNPNIWKTEVDPDDIEAARKFSAPGRENLKRDVRSALDSLISGRKVGEVRGTRRPSVSEQRAPSAETQKNLRFNLPQNARQVEKSVTGVSIQPSGTYTLRSSASSSPRSSPDPALNISHRVDSRYTEDISPRVSLSSQHHASKTTQMSGGSGYSVARVTETRKRMEIRGLN